ncbi:MAG TPA: glutamine synthetase III [Firmicutes bacterium]|nr:glutamine synthetase III [Bacillota bacterium]
MNSDFSKTFGCKVFNDTVMRQWLPKNIYISLKRSISEGEPLQPHIADVVAEAMKNWASELGATHYTHWFQPMNNITAGKHDSFVTPQGDGTAVVDFSGKELIKGEPDASSFPNGGLRNTFEARGYTAWDCTSPAFVRDHTLYIPTAFCSYTGEALDGKTPLLRSMDAISGQALRILRIFGNTSSKRVIATVGAEQEYFLIDRAQYEKRLDLKITGRTLFGANPSKGQQMDDHYCGRIRLRVADFMRQLDQELWELGVPSKTKHNEVAPAQHELAPVFESANTAIDHNQLTMELMRIVAKRNNLACLLHEKPFESVNGSGKHNNWSLATDDGYNLLDPGKTPYENMQFLVFLSAVIDAVDNYGDLLRMTAASAGNDHRLGANEAPPAIISIFLGEHLTSILEEIATGSEHAENLTRVLETGVATLPRLNRDDSDRNRTSPFAFTGNKFEFRMVGSSASISQTNFVLNAIVADTLSRFADRLQNAADFDNEVRKIVADTMKEHGRIIFNGNNYSDEWVQEAARRGLPNLSNTVDAITALREQKNIDVLVRQNILSESECHSRYEIRLENYSKTIDIEAHTMLEMLHRQILPAIIRFAGDTAASYNNLKTAGFENSAVQHLLWVLSENIIRIQKAATALKKALQEVDCTDILAQAQYYRDQVTNKMAVLRKAVDETEEFVSSDYWPMPTYTDLLHRV